MKTLTCEQIGGPCDMQLQAGNETDMMQEAWSHMQREHPQFAESIRAMPQSGRDSLRAAFHAVWIDTPDDHDMMGNGV